MSEFITKLIPKDDIIDLLEEAEEIDCSRSKYGTINTYVFKDGDDYYKFSVEFNPGDGIQLYDDVTAYLVRPETKTITVWKKVKQESK